MTQKQTVKPKMMVENVSCILPQQSQLGGVYVGNVYGAQNAQVLKQYGIRSVLTSSIQTADIKYNPTDIPFHMKIDAHDKEDYNIREHLNECIHFIEQSRKFTNVFIHCYAGVSRSVAIVCGYIMWKFKWDYLTTIAFMKAKRIVSKPNDGFQKQLKQIQRIIIDTSYSKREIIPSKIKEQKILTTTNARSISAHQIPTASSSYQVQVSPHLRAMSNHQQQLIQPQTPVPKQFKLNKNHIVSPNGPSKRQQPYKNDLNNLTKPLNETYQVFQQQWKQNIDNQTFQNVHSKTTGQFKQERQSQPFQQVMYQTVYIDDRINRNNVEGNLDSAVSSSTESWYKKEQNKQRQSHASLGLSSKPHSIEPYNRHPLPNYYPQKMPPHPQQHVYQTGSSNINKSTNYKNVYNKKNDSQNESIKKLQNEYKQFQKQYNQQKQKVNSRLLLHSNHPLRQQSSQKIMLGGMKNKSSTRSQSKNSLHMNSTKHNAIPVPKIMTTSHQNIDRPTNNLHLTMLSPQKINLSSINSKNYQQVAYLNGSSKYDSSYHTSKPRQNTFEGNSYQSPRSSQNNIYTHTSPNFKSPKNDIFYKTFQQPHSQQMHQGFLNQKQSSKNNSRCLIRPKDLPGYKGKY